MTDVANFASGFVRSGGASGMLGVTLLHNTTGPTGSRVRMRLSWRADLCRSASEPSLHAGAIITAIDSAMGMSGMLFMQAASGIATLDFRYDEFSAPAARADVLIEAHCERLDGDLLFITGSCLNDDGTLVHGRATGRFIRTAASSMQFAPGLLSMQQATMSVTPPAEE